MPFLRFTRASGGSLSPSRLWVDEREDDKEETVKNRIQVYFQKTMPLIEYYKTAGLLVEVDGEQSIEKVHEDLYKSITQTLA